MRSRSAKRRGCQQERLGQLSLAVSSLAAVIDHVDRAVFRCGILNLSQFHSSSCEIILVRG